MRSQKESVYDAFRNARENGSAVGSSELFDQVVKAIEDGLLDGRIGYTKNRNDRSEVRKYSRSLVKNWFRKDERISGTKYLSPSSSRNGDEHSKKRSTKTTWPRWADLSDEVGAEVARLITPFVRFPHPSVIEAIAKRNAKDRQFLSDLLGTHRIDPSLYLWDGSACVFPGIRRGIGKYEPKRSIVSQSERSSKQALYLDDNHIPRHIWSFVLCGIKGGADGPPDYALGHIFAHKDYNKDQIAAEIKITSTHREGMFNGLFTSAANTCYVHKACLRPTDHNGRLRRLIQFKAQQLYEDVCALLPTDCNIAQPSKNDLDPDQFTWPDPFGTTEHLDRLFEFRSNLLQTYADDAEEKTGPKRNSA